MMTGLFNCFNQKITRLLIFLRPKLRRFHNLLCTFGGTTSVVAELDDIAPLAAADTRETAVVGVSFASGTSAVTVCMPPPSLSMPRTRPRRVLRSLLMSPILLVGTVTWRVTIGSSKLGFACAKTWRKHWLAAVLNAASLLSTS